MHILEYIAEFGRNLTGLLNVAKNAQERCFDECIEFYDYYS